jgi:serine/threonine-protein kinase
VAQDLFGIVGSLQAGAFRVTGVVAEGGFGIVYRAHHEGFRADVALKCLKIPGTMSAEQRAEFLLKFKEEGELLFRLSALIPSVVRPLHVGTLEGARDGAFVPFIALEWLEGESLESLVARRRDAGKPPLDLNRAVALLGPAARALECAHKFPTPEGRISVLHRDLKPENLFISRGHGQDIVKVLDFGIGKVKSEATQMVGRASAEGGLSAFTPAFGAPEQWLPKRYGQTGPWTDVWGFALTMVQVLTGKPPLEGDLQALMGSCLDERQRPTPRALGAQLPDHVEAAFTRALAVDPHDRYQDIGQFWDALEGATGITTQRVGAEPVSTSLSEAPPPAVESSAIPDLQIDLPPQPRTQLSARDPKPRPARPPQESDSDLNLLGNDASQLQLQGDLGVSSRLEPSGLQPSLPRPRRAVPRVPSVRPSAAAVFSRAIPALKLLALATAIMLADFAYAAYAGEAFTVGPARAFWIAGPLAVYGLFQMAMAVLGE